MFLINYFPSLSHHERSATWVNWIVFSDLRSRLSLNVCVVVDLSECVGGCVCGCVSVERLLGSLGVLPLCFFLGQFSIMDMSSFVSLPLSMYLVLCLVCHCKIQFVLTLCETHNFFFIHFSPLLD